MFPARLSSASTRILAGLILCWSCLAGYGHAIGENYVFLRINKDGQIDGRFEFHADDLHKKLGLEVRASHAEEMLTKVNDSAAAVHEYILSHFSMSGDSQPIAIEFTKQGVLEEGSPFVQYYFQSAVDSVPNLLTFRHRLMYENDRLHRGLLCLSYNPILDIEYGEERVGMIFSRSLEEQSLDLRQPIKDLLRPRDFVWQGMLHIWVGLDHILFLVVLLLPAVLQQADGRWLPVESFGKAMMQVVKIVTVFTVAHSITLALAALDFISLPSRLVESVIAASIILVAANNVVPKLKEGPVLVIFGFGLFHGMGFATVMGELPFRMQNLVKVLIAFNVGVEIGQLAIVVVVFGLLYAFRQWQGYQRVFLQVGSAAAGVVAIAWFIERAFGL